MEMSTYVDEVDKGFTVMKKTVGVGPHIIIKVNENFIKEDSPDEFENRDLLTALMQAVVHVSEVG